MSSTVYGSSVLQLFKCDNAVEIHNWIMFDFYTRLPHMYLSRFNSHWQLAHVHRIISVTALILANAGEDCERNWFCHYAIYQMETKAQARVTALGKI